MPAYARVAIIVSALACVVMLGLLAARNLAVLGSGAPDAAGPEAPARQAEAAADDQQNSDAAEAAPPEARGVAEVGADSGPDVAFSLGEIDTSGRAQVRAARPMRRIPGVYPPMAAARGLQGECEMLFDISAEGQPINVRTASCTDPIFRDPSIAAVKDWRYLPRRVDGEQTPERDLKTTIDFQLAGG